MGTSKLFIVIYSLSILFFSCSKDKPLEEPGTGRINLTIEWDKINKNATLPNIFIAQLNENVIENINGNTYILKEIPAGTHKLSLYNNAKNVHLEQSKATIKYSDNTSVQDIPDWFFSSVKEISIHSGSTTDIVMQMKHQTGEVTIQAIIDEKDKKLIKSLHSELQGVSDCFDILNEQCTGNQKVINLMEPVSEGYSSYYRLLGIDENSTPGLFFHFIFNNGTQKSLYVNLEGTCIEHFNYIKHESHLFTFYIEINQDGPSINASIKGWKENPIDITPTEQR